MEVKRCEGKGNALHIRLIRRTNEVINEWRYNFETQQAVLLTSGALMPGIKRLRLLMRLARRQNFTL